MFCLAKGTFAKELENIHESLKETISLCITQMRRYSLCLDLWTKKGMTSSFLGISICGYVPERQKVEHMMLILHKVELPHTGEMIAETVNTTMQIWGIRPTRILTVITDNGSNMVKAFKQYFQELPGISQGNDDNSDDEDCGADEDLVVVYIKIKVDSTALFRPHDTACGPRMYTVRGCVTFALICPSYCAEDTQFIGGSTEVNL